MGIEIQINQQQTNVKMLETFFRLGRCSIDDLNYERDKLKKLELEFDFVKQVKDVLPQKQIKAPVVVNTKTTSIKQHLLQDIRKLRTNQAEISNQLGGVPNNKNCQHLTSQSIAYTFEIEKLWTKYRYLEKNGVLPEENNQIEEEKSVELLRLEAERKKFSEERSKLKKKIAEIGNTEKLQEKWVARKYVVDGIIQDLDGKIRSLK
jgi:hypothetical protein